MRYVAARHGMERRERAYRIYVTDALKILGNLNLRYVDIVSDRVSADADPEEIKARICSKLGAMGDEEDDYGYI